MVENKSSFFQVTIELLSMSKNVYKVQALENSMDLVLSAMKVSNTWYRFVNQEQIIYLFRCEDRKRRGQLDRYCQKNLPVDQYPITYEIKSYTNPSFQAAISRLVKNKNFTLTHQPIPFSEYKGNDIKIFEDRTNWHPWQTSIYDSIFDDHGNYRIPDQRKIVSLIDTNGGSGKSSFFKFLYYKNPTTIGRMDYGSASQLRSAAVNIGMKNLYIVDLARAKSKNDHQEDLLSVLEDLKSGLVTNAMYGSGKTLIMEPPHILVSSNYILDYDLLSKDRWEVYKILPTNRLKRIDPKKYQKKSKKKLKK